LPFRVQAVEPARTPLPAKLALDVAAIAVALVAHLFDEQFAANDDLIAVRDKQLQISVFSVKGVGEFSDHEFH
jgi:hypothetical protein